MSTNPTVSMIALLAVDFDYSSLYPSLMTLLNSGRNTLKVTLISIAGENDIARFASNSLTLTECSVMLGKEFLGLPGYVEFRHFVRKQLVGSN